ncbi:MAG: thioredoxin domain-containing protein [Candidatus Kerfeldbacteria bacterium]|nr:thioredoxin domain-containing protein [Candidatus Kerfeldbacteria bacterium]
MDPNQPQGEQRLTKRQRRELKRQQKEKARSSSATRKKVGIWFVWALVAFVVVGLVWAVIAAGGSNNGTTKSGDLRPMKADTTDPYLGDQNSQVVVREFGDFQCPACKAVQPLVTDITKEYGNRIRLDFNDYPLVSIHKNALFAAEAAHCANDQGKFWAFHDKLYDRQSDWATLAKKDANDKFKQYAADLGLNADTFNACVDSEEKRDAVQEDINQGNAALVGATPTFFVNDQKFEGIPQKDELKKLIDGELAKTVTPLENTNSAATTEE